MRWRSFVVAMGFGIVAVFITLLVSQTYLWWIFPWALPGNVENILYSWMTGGEMAYQIRSAWFSIGLSLVGGLVIGVLGGWEVARRDVL